MKELAKRKFFLLISIIAPALFLLTFLPIWNGKEIILSGVIVTALFVFQCVCVILAAVRLILDITSKNVSGTASVIFTGFAVCSIILTCFYCSIFMLELLNIPWFPAQD